MQRTFITVAALLAATAVAEAEVGPKHLSYLNAWRLHDSVAKVIANLGEPDFVVLSSDPSEAGREMKEYGIPRQLVWTVKGCQPVKVDFDASGRSIGVDYSALKSICMKEIAAALTPEAKYSCKNPDRQRYCR